ncbi:MULTISPECIES: YaiI/YqxD family protein [unclassified Moraxella]|uniref:YaiI/YqxD family protein n=1 Tax=unclassified Moraxella TaxID=2685852 RepID=UPI003AF54C82
MTLWIDADAIPNVAKQLIVKTAERTQTPTIFVANRAIALPRLPILQMIVVEGGFDKADDYIAENCVSGDVVVTSDIPLANDCIEKGAKVVTARGFVYDKDNIKQKLNMRDFMDTMRSTGVLEPQQMGGQAPYSDKDKQQFANILNAWIR